MANKHRNGAVSLFATIIVIITLTSGSSVDASWGDWMGDLFKPSSSKAKNTTTLPNRDSVSPTTLQTLHPSSSNSALADFDFRLDSAADSAAPLLFAPPSPPMSFYLPPQQQQQQSADADDVQNDEYLQEQRALAEAMSRYGIVAPSNSDVDSSDADSSSNNNIVDSNFFVMPNTPSRPRSINSNDMEREFEMHVPVPATLANMNEQHGFPFLGDMILPGGAVARDIEHQPYLPLFGKPLMLSGGAGEGDQALGPEGDIPNVHEIKTDSLLPAYCDPPNPCPIGFSAADGCVEGVSNTAEFSRDYQGRQDCQCDADHMFDCAAAGGGGGGHSAPGPGGPQHTDGNDEDNMIDIGGGGGGTGNQHKNLVAKKYHIEGSNSIISYERNLHPRRKRSATQQHGNYWNSGPVLTKRVAKKSAPRHLMARQ